MPFTETSPVQVARQIAASIAREAAGVAVLSSDVGPVRDKPFVTAGERRA
jgi:hypothetical protein